MSLPIPPSVRGKRKREDEGDGDEGEGATGLAFYALADTTPELTCGRL